jgi:hypothetical protein
MGMYLHFKTQETENDQLLDGGSLGLERKLYYRELIARFSHHLALNWNLGEENTNTDTERKQFCDYFEQVDPYGHLVSFSCTYLMCFQFISLICFALSQTVGGRSC